MHVSCSPSSPGSVVFRTQPRSLEHHLEELSEPRNRNRLFGGHVLVLASEFTCFGCE